MADLFAAAYNPDVLTCLANLSNDEVFTPPELANQVLDMLPNELWSDANATFLDPCCKSGVFLREIAKRLIVGLADQIPDLQERVDHIFQKQLFGIAITELTSLLSRRSLYCSKWPNGKYSVTRFESAEGEQKMLVLRRIQKGAGGRARRARDPRLRVHPPQESRGAVQHEVRCYRGQPAVPTQRWGE